MRNAKRGRGSHRAVYLCAAMALGLALSACGGGGSSSSSAAAGPSSATQSSTPGAAVSGTSSSAPPTASATSVTINWTPPTENVDNSPLTNLAGYNIHYGTASGQYTQTVSVSNPGIATYVVQNLAPGTYYFAVAAVNASGMESPLSAEVSATVN